LLKISDEQAREMRSRAFYLRKKVLEFFKLEQIKEMADRAETYGMTIVAVEMIQKLRIHREILYTSNLNFEKFCQKKLLKSKQSVESLQTG
jgi:hypothetical protein